MSSRVQLVHTTANRPGAIAILQLHGRSDAIMNGLTGVTEWPVGRVRLVSFAGIDDGLAVRLTDTITQLMPHGGPRVVQRLTARLIELGVQLARDSNIDPRELYPEAHDSLEAVMLQTLARAQSPQSVNLLLDQPRRWSRWRETTRSAPAFSAGDLARSARLNRLIDPPMVILAGEPNVGKSTLSNALLGRSMSITLDMPGTTRDYTAARIELAGLVVDWHDTPGMRKTSDPIEQRAIELAMQLFDRADLLIAMTDHEHEWPQLPRKPDLHIVNKVDAHDCRRPNAIAISAVTGAGLAEFVNKVRSALVPDEDLEHPGPWLFDPRLISESEGCALPGSRCP